MIEDYLYRFKNLYRKSPWWFKGSVGWVYSRLPMRIRYGKIYKEYRAFLEESQWWSRERLQEWQQQQLSKLLNHAYENVPYYRRVFDERGLKPNDIQDFNDLEKLPYLTRDLVRENLEDLVARNYPKSKRLFFATGGSTGTPLGFYWEKGKTRSLERAFMWRQWSWMGYEPERRDRTVLLRGLLTKNPLGDYDPIENSLILSSYNLREDTLGRYIQRIRKFKPISIQAYPSVITILASYMLRNSIPPIESLTVILCGSENLFSQQRELIERAFSSRVFSWYGQGECVCLAGNCEHSNDYHVFPEYGITEIIGANGNPIPESEEGTGKIVATGFNNYLMPFIRYRTGDIGVRVPGTCRCGRNYPLLKRIEGREQEYILTKDGRIVSLTGLIFGLHFSAFKRIKQMQLVQEKKGSIIINIVRTDNYSPEDEEEIGAKMQDAVGGTLDIEFNYVNDIERTKRGKHKFLIQKLPVKFGLDSLQGNLREN
jgi:phenylacetate-CoA ligase